MSLKVGIYLRISDDRDGHQTATARQEEDCRAYATRVGWEIADVFEDVDLSAFKRNVKRPEFERMLEAVRNGAIDGVLAWKIDRITRRQRDFVRLDEECVDASAFIATVTDGIDTRSPVGRFVGELLVSQARMESENASIRGARKHLERAKQGQPNTGGTRAFGYNAARTAIIDEEAVLIREAAERILAGDSLRSVCFDWQERGVTSPAGKPWRQTSLRRMLSSALLSGQREHHGELHQGVWPAILTPEQTDDLRALLNARHRRTSKPNARSYLLTGFLVCGRCGEKLMARPRLDKVRRYVCGRVPGEANCGKLARLAEPVEEVVSRAVFMALDGVDISSYMGRERDASYADLVRSVRSEEQALEALAHDHYVERTIGRTEFFATRATIVARLEDARSALAATADERVLSGVVGAGEEVARRWPDAPLDWKRAIIGSVIDHVRLEPALKGRNKFDPSLVVPMWKF